MLRFFTAITFIFYLQVVPAAAQLPAPEASTGSIPDSLFKMQAPPDTPYVITNKEVNVTFQEEEGGIIATLRHYMQLKVFDASAREASLISIPYYQEDDMEQISEIRGFTHLSPQKRVPLQDKAIKTIDINGRYNVKEFAMPAVEDGAVLEYSYVIRRRYIEELPDFYLSQEVPTSRAQITITYPQYLRYEGITENYEGSVDHTFAFRDTSSVPKIFIYPRPDPVVTEQWTATDIPATEKEPFISSLNDYRGKIKFILSAFGLPRQELDTNWEVVVAKLRRNTNPMEQAEKYRYAQSIGDSIASARSGASRRELQNSIYRYVNERVKFNSAFGPYSTTPDSAVLAGQPADQAAINQTLLAMLRGAGIEAYPALTATRSAGKINREFPSYYQFNALVVRSTIGDSNFWMDASYPHSQPNLLRRDMNTETALLLRDSTFSWQQMKAPQSTFSIRAQVDAQLHANGNLSGTITSHQTGYPAQQIRQKRADGQSDAAILRQTLFDGYGRLQLDDVRIRHAEQYDRAVKAEADFVIENYARSFTDGLQFPPMMIGYLRENPFDQNRQLPVTLGAPEQLQLSYHIQLPGGASPAGLPQDNQLQLPGAVFKEQYNSEGQSLNYQFDIDISDQEFGLDRYPQLVDLYTRWVELSNQAWQIRR